MLSLSIFVFIRDGRASKTGQLLSLFFDFVFAARIYDGNMLFEHAADATIEHDGCSESLCMRAILSLPKRECKQFRTLIKS